jgi:hypothetical protein
MSKMVNEMNGVPRNVARHRMPDIKSYENIIKLKMIVFNSIIKNMEINHWDRGKESS